MGKKQEMESEEKQKIHNPTKSRSCTDVLCLLLFLAFLGGWGAISYIAFSQGNPLQIVYPSNSSGQICGRDGNDGKPNLFFHDLTKCISVAAALGCPTPQVCVESCPEKTTSLYACLKASEVAGIPPSTICLDLLEEYREYCTPMSDEEWKLGKEDPLQLIQDRKCPAYILQSIPVIGRCIPDFGIIGNSTSANDTIISDGFDAILDANGDTLNSQKVYEILEYMTELLNAREISEKVWADLVSSWYWILAGQGLALVVSFLWILLMRFLPGKRF
ncbi:choline transporter-like protein 4 [Eurytemora carolleeae]|uniref:choline transporter-like protein 4 n=1 Tax=Eurytemora carolleeae TaxID=1294199 RepID=UPI000C7955EB|nr:choline transporter-like protein 4 [Eurytemora carolleeae]|eukprot:XP_023337602.1 choline transporter-like protein 4 [Eurytemora affinis]